MGITKHLLTHRFTQNKALALLFICLVTLFAFINWQPRQTMVVPANNPITLAKINLGKKLFYDTRLSYNYQKSCASCHSAQFAFTDGYKQSLGAEGYHVEHNSPGLQNCAYSSVYTYLDSSIHTLERQMENPLFNENPKELGLKAVLAQRLIELKNDTQMFALFKEAFPTEQNCVSKETIIKAIATYERSLVSFNSNFDRYLQGNKQALSASALRGMNMFFSDSLNCKACHSGINLGATYEYANSGISNETKAYRVPSLRNIAFTAPYLHNGSIATLTELVAQYANLGSAPKINRGSKQLGSYSLNQEQKNDLQNFLYSLSDSSFISKHILDIPKYE